MYKDYEFELSVQAEDTVEEFAIETSENDVVLPLNERLLSWLETVDN